MTCCLTCLSSHCSRLLALLGRLGRYPRILSTTAVCDQANVEIEPGACRTVDLSLSPFNLPVTTVLEWRCGEDGRFISQLWEPR